MSTLRLKDAERTSALAGVTIGNFSSLSMRLETSRAINPISVESRYSGHRVLTIRRGDREFRTIETWERPSVPEETGGRGERFFFVDAAYAYRSDRIAYAVFGTPTYDWWILASNGLYENTQLVHGTTLRIVPPPVERIETVQRRPF